MALSANRLGDAMWAAVKAQNGAYTPGLTVDQDNKGRDLWRAIATEIVTEVTGHAAVTATGADPQGGVVSSTGTVA